MPMPWIASATALNPLGNLVGSGSWLPSAERLNAIQQSSLHPPPAAPVSQRAAREKRGGRERAGGGAPVDVDVAGVLEASLDHGGGGLRQDVGRHRAVVQVPLPRARHGQRQRQSGGAGWGRASARY